MHTEVRPEHAARARLRLALRAEQAWGAGGLRDFRPSTLRDPESPLPLLREIRPEAALPPVGCAGGESVEALVTARGLFGSPDSGTVAPHVVEEPALTDPPLPRARRIELLQALEAEEVRICTRCPLHSTRTSTVFGEGDPEAPLMFIGEGPGENEDLTGRPFVGRAGELLGKMIQGMGLRREQVYIANVVKCRPPNNRVPTSVEVSTCTQFLHRQIEWVRPKVIVTLGLPSARHLLKSTLPMGRLRGQWHDWRGIRVMPT